MARFATVRSMSARRPHRLGGGAGRPACGARGARGARRPRRLAHAGPDRLPHAPRVRGQSRARVRATPRGRELRRHLARRAVASWRRCALRGPRPRTNCCARASRGCTGCATKASPRSRSSPATVSRPPAELKMLRVARALGDAHGVEVRTTLLAAHALPPEFAGRADDYVALVCEEIIPAAAARAWPTRWTCSANVSDSRRRRRGAIFEASRAHGLPRQAARRPALRLGRRASSPRNSAALSADHLEYASEAGVTRSRVPARSPCCCPAHSISCARRGCRRLRACASKTSRSRSQPIAIPAPRP